MVKETKSVMALREQARREIAGQVEEFLARGGKIEQVPILKNRHPDMTKASDNSQASVIESW